MRLMEGMRLRMKDVDFDRHVIIVREAEGNKSRVVMLLRARMANLRMQLLRARALWQADRQAQRGGVETPHALRRQVPQSGLPMGVVLANIRTVQKLLGHSDVSTTMI